MTKVTQPPLNTVGFEFDFDGTRAQSLGARLTFDVVDGSLDLGPLVVGAGALGASGNLGGELHVGVPIGESVLNFGGGPTLKFFDREFDSFTSTYRLSEEVISQIQPNETEETSTETDEPSSDVDGKRSAVSGVVNLGVVAFKDRYKYLGFDAMYDFNVGYQHGKVGLSFAYDHQLPAGSSNVFLSADGVAELQLGHESPFEEHLLLCRGSMIFLSARTEFGPVALGVGGAYERKMGQTDAPGMTGAEESGQLSAMAMIGPFYISDGGLVPGKAPSQSNDEKSGFILTYKRDASTTVLGEGSDYFNESLMPGLVERRTVAERSELSFGGQVAANVHSSRSQKSFFGFSASLYGVQSAEQHETKNVMDNGNAVRDEESSGNTEGQMGIRGFLKFFVKF